MAKILLNVLVFTQWTGPLLGLRPGFTMSKGFCLKAYADVHPNNLFGLTF